MGIASSPSTVSQGTGARNTVWNATRLTRAFAGTPKTYGLLAFGVPPQGLKHAPQAANPQDIGCGMSGRANTPLLSALLQGMPHTLAKTRSFWFLLFNRLWDEFRLSSRYGFTLLPLKAAFVPPDSTRVENSA